MPTVQLTIQQLQEAIENLTVEEFRQLNQLLDKRRRERLKEIAQKARQQSMRVNPREAERIIQEAVAEVRAEHAVDRRS
jgi:restriction endonuclease Mrr